MLIEISDNAERGRFELTADGSLVSFASYRLRYGQISFDHTETDPQFAGRGLATRLIEAALGSARDRGLAVLPFCSFVCDYLRRHPEYLSLVPADQRARFKL